MEGPPEDLPAGEFAHHEEHGHVHFEGFALYELLSLTPEGELGSVIASSNKTTYCLMETTQVDRELSERTRQSDHDGCGEEVQGISPGWGDTYGAGVEGQELNVEAVFDGTYALRSTADPDDLLLESGEENNSAVTYLEIEDDDVRSWTDPQAGPRRVLPAPHRGQKTKKRGDDDGHEETSEPIAGAGPARIPGKRHPR